MNIFELSPAEGKPAHVVDYRIDFLSNSRSVKTTSATPGAHFTCDITKGKIKYVSSSKTEGILNFYLCYFSNGKCNMHVFGKLVSEQLKFEIKLGKHSEASFDQLYDRIGVIILKSQSMLKRYYNNHDAQAIQRHLLAYLK
jgi:hypothetical protein